jgi:hypothetical protein
VLKTEEKRGMRIRGSNGEAIMSKVYHMQVQKYHNQTPYYVHSVHTNKINNFLLHKGHII